MRMFNKKNIESGYKMLYTHEGLSCIVICFCIPQTSCSHANSFSSLLSNKNLCNYFIPRIVKIWIIQYINTIYFVLCIIDFVQPLILCFILSAIDLHHTGLCSASYCFPLSSSLSMVWIIDFTAFGLNLCKKVNIFILDFLNKDKQWMYE